MFLSNPSQMSMSASRLEERFAGPSGARIRLAPTAASPRVSQATKYHRRATVWVSLNLTPRFSHAHTRTIHA